jgi:hypothetical protein
MRLKIAVSVVRFRPWAPSLFVDFPLVHRLYTPAYQSDGIDGREVPNGATLGWLVVAITGRAGSSHASGPRSVSVAGSGQVNPAAIRRLTQSCTVLRATPTATAMARSDAPHSNFTRRISRTRRIDALSAGVDPPLALTRRQTPHRPGGRAAPPPWGLADTKSECPADLLRDAQSCGMSHWPLPAAF